MPILIYFGIKISTSQLQVKLQDQYWWMAAIKFPYFWIKFQKILHSQLIHSIYVKEFLVQAYL